MEKKAFDVYERPEAEEVKLVTESTILSGLNEDPNDSEEICYFDN